MDVSSAVSSYAQYIDHTLLKPEATPEDIVKLCSEAREYSFKTVCVNSCYVSLCASELAGSGVDVCSVIGFPLGTMESAAKAFEAMRAIELGAAEVDMVINVGLLKAGDLEGVKNDIEIVSKACGKAGLKVILETGQLTDDEKKIICEMCKEIGVAFVKTSTGFGHGGATVEDVRLMRSVVGQSCGVKASGGVRDASDAKAMIDAGATRLGASSGVAIVTGETSNSQY